MKDLLKGLVAVILGFIAVPALFIVICGIIPVIQYLLGIHS